MTEEERNQIEERFDDLLRFAKDTKTFSEGAAWALNAKNATVFPTENLTSRCDAICKKIIELKKKVALLPSSFTTTDPVMPLPSQDGKFLVEITRINQNSNVAQD